MKQEPYSRPTTCQDSRLYTCNIKHAQKQEEAEQEDRCLPILEGDDEETGEVVSIQADEKAML